VRPTILLPSGLPTLLLLAVLALSPACGRPAPPARHLLLVTLDTTRADRLGCYGHPGAGTPWLDALAARGARWQRVYASAPLTLPSHVSILTGLHPPHTGVHNNGDATMTAGVRTLADRLAANGFFTAAAVGADIVAGRFPVRRGFAAYDDRMFDPRGSGGLERRADLVVDAAQGLLAGRQDRRLFIWVHFFDPHDPYDPPPALRERFAADPYQGEIAAVDSALARLVPAIEQSLGGEPLLIAVVGDHGEALGEHGEMTHGFFVYEGTLRTPLILAGPRVPKGKLLPGPVQTVDLAPTLLELLGIPVPDEFDGVRLDLAGDRPGPPPKAYAETELPLRHFGWSPLYAAIDGTIKFIDAPKPELYDLAGDPQETFNQVNERPADADELAAFARSVRGASSERPAAPMMTMDPALWGLGYIGFGAAAPAGGELADPKDRVAVYRKFQDARLAVLHGDGPRALTLLDELRATEDGPGLRYLHGQALVMNGRVDHALAEYDEMSRKWPDFPGLVRERGCLLVMLNRFAEALPLLDAGLQIAPGDPKALMFRGLAKESIGDLAGAESDYRQLLAIVPAQRGASMRLATVLSRLGRRAEARTILEEYVRRAPEDGQAHALLGQL